MLKQKSLTPLTTIFCIRRNVFLNILRTLLLRLLLKHLAKDKVLTRLLNTSCVLVQGGLRGTVTNA